MDRIVMVETLAKMVQDRFGEECDPMSLDLAREVLNLTAALRVFARKLDLE